MPDLNLPGLFRHAVTWAQEQRKQCVRILIAESEGTVFLATLNLTHFMSQVNGNATQFPCELGFMGVKVQIDTAALDDGISILELH